MRKKLLLIFLIALMSITLIIAGCEKKDDASAETKAPAETEMKSEETQEPETTEAAPPEPIEFEIMVRTKYTDLRNSDNGDPSKGQAILDYITEQTGVTLKFNIPAYGGYYDVVTTTLAAGQDLPDAISWMDVNGETFQQAMDNGLIVPITPYWENSPNLKKYTTEKAKISFTRNGEIWQMPILRSNARLDGIILRWDWLQDLGFTDITLDQEYLDLEDWFEICEAMTFNDPDGNGEDDTWGFTHVSSWHKIPKHLLQVFGSNQGWQLNDSGALVDTNVTTNWDKTKEAINYYKDMIDAKIIHPEAFTMNSEEVRDKLYKGQIGGFTGFGSGYSLPGFMLNIQKIDADGSLKWFNGLIGPAGESKYVYSGTDTAGIAVTADCEAPERLVALFDWFLGDGYNTVTFGPNEGSDYSIDENGQAYYTKEQYLERQKYNYAISFQVFRRGETLVPLRTSPFTMEAREVNVTEEFNNAWVEWADKWEFDVAFDENYGYYPEKSQALFDSEEEFENVIIAYLNGAVEEAAMDEALRDMMDAGYSDYMADIDTWYKENIAE